MLGFYFFSPQPGAKGAIFTTTSILLNLSVKFGKGKQQKEATGTSMIIQNGYI
jgi:hypothetical protein